MSDFQTESTPTARKVHKCGECHGHIEPGQKYQLISGSWEGEMGSFKTCMPCLAARHWPPPNLNGVVMANISITSDSWKKTCRTWPRKSRSQDGRRFHTYRLQALMSRRWLSAKALFTAA